MHRQLPFCSVIVPTRGRNKQLAACLAALAAQDYPSDSFEVIVVDDGSPSSPEEVVSPLRGKLGVSVISQAHAGPARARNTGAARATGALLAFTDDDCAPTRGWLAALAGRHTEAPEQAIGGLTTCSLRNNHFSTASQLLISYLYEYFNSRNSASGGPRFFTSNNLALPRERFLDIGGFDASFPSAAAEDRELCERWHRRGFQLLYAPEAVVEHAHYLTLLSFWRQHFAYGRGAHRFHQLRAKYSESGNSTGVKVEPLSFYTDLLRYPFVVPESDRGSNSALAVTSALALTQVANAAGYYWEALTHSASSKRNVQRDAMQRGDLK
ncbi:MAG: glycosyltransferase [Anaerolineae bacterium]|nr:glycosyltransferase [Gemmatimonadaceae bacterium]